MDHVGLFLARLILTPMLLYICNKYDLGRARAKKNKKNIDDDDDDARPWNKKWLKKSIKVPIISGLTAFLPFL